MSSLVKTDWNIQFGTDEDDRAQSIAVAADGSFYVAVASKGQLDAGASRGTGAYLRKYSAKGSLVWSRAIQGSGLYTTPGTSYGPVHLAMDREGAVYVVGATSSDLNGQTNNGSRDAFICKFSASGESQWTRLYGSTYRSSTEGANDVAVAPDGSIYITGTKWSSETGSFLTDAFVVKYSSTGVLETAKTFRTGSSLESSRSISVDQDGTVYVAGYTRGSFSGQINKGSEDIFLRAYSSGGDLRWTRMIGSSYYDDAYSTAVSSDGSIYVAGVVCGDIGDQENKGSPDIFLAKYDKYGNKKWNKTFGTMYDDRAYAVTASSDGNIYLTGYTYSSLDPLSGNKGGG